MKDSTLCFLLRGDEICLAMKKRGFGTGKWNGAGGKVQQGETTEEAALRELSEELSVTAVSKQLNKVAVIEFVYEDKPEWNQRTHIFFLSTWLGEPRESEEMRPEWFLHKNLPFSSMWIDDPLWLPLVLSGVKLEGAIFFESQGTVIRSHTLSPVSPGNKP